jgi:hypothetical protein
MACTDHLINIMEPLVPFIESSNIGICDNSIKKHLSLLNRNDYDTLISIISGQKAIIKTYPYYSLYKVSLYDKKFSHHLDIYDESGDENQTSIQYEDNNLTLHIFSVESLIYYLGDTENFLNNRYLFFPVNFTSENKRAGHMACLIIDIKENKIYLYDPNGISSYFNNIFAEMVKKSYANNNNENNEDEHNAIFSEYYFDAHELIDILIEGYVDDIYKRLGIKYEYISSKIWNPSKCVLNPSFDSNVIIGSGHCVVTTVMFLHYLHLTNDDIKNVFQKLGSLNTNELIYLINSYGYWLYVILEPILNKKMKNPMYAKVIKENNNNNNNN